MIINIPESTFGVAFDNVEVREVDGDIEDWGSLTIKDLELIYPVGSHYGLYTEGKRLAKHAFCYYYENDDKYNEEEFRKIIEEWFL
jgi:hypothetical protein